MANPMDRLKLFRELEQPASAALLRAAAACDATRVSEVTKLRSLARPELVMLALEVADARQRAKAKFPDDWERLWLDRPGIEQASSQMVADAKAKRFAALGSPVLDLCCGIGGDALSLQRAVGVKLAVDLDPTRAWMTWRNVGCGVTCADVVQLPGWSEPFHLDPSRRDGAGRRRHDVDDYLPPRAWWAKLIERRHPGALKLGPGLDVSQVPQLDEPGVELQFISEGGTLVQAVLWIGALAQHPRSALLLPEGVELVGSATLAPLGELGAYLMAVDAAVERAGLLGELARQHGLHLPHPALGLLTGPVPVTSPWWRCFELVERMPWRMERVRQWLKQHDAGIVEVKTRGGAVNPDAAQRELSSPGAGAGGARYCVFVLRFDRRVEALVTRRVD